ncbi:MAG: 50S ribosomal protein L18 [Chloroflexi bacterium]|nr:50S ribosomal protein L18 [Gemmatimonadales bacterium]MYD66596.1 50S ribosomal protein L18 [Chloroflexota bacterium]
MSSSQNTRRSARQRRHRRLRKRVAGTVQRPRLAVFRSARHIYAQVIDDRAGHTLVAASDLEPSVRENGSGTKTDRARAVGTVLAQRAREAGHEAVVFDRGGFSFKGRVRALAEAAREEGLVF